MQTFFSFEKQNVQKNTQVSPQQPQKNPFLSNASQNVNPFLSEQNTPSNPFATIQAKLAIGQPNDKYEQEADQIASQVVKNSTQQIQSKCESCESEEKIGKKAIQKSSPEEEEMMQGKIIQKQGVEEEEMMQGKMIQKKDEASPKLENQIHQSQGKGNEMDKQTKTEMEKNFDVSFNDVKIHTDSQAVQMNEQLQSHAFTVKNDVYFNSGKYNPQSEQGKELLAHELTHVVQQNGSEIQNKRKDG